MDSAPQSPPPTRRQTAEWIIAPYAPVELFAAAPDVPPLVAQVLHARGYTTPESIRQFLAIDAQAGDSLAMQDMPRAVERIGRAIQGGEAIALYGDYDCDGVTACALLHEVLGRLGANARTYIPNRFEEGYGLNSGALDKLKAEGMSLVITVDCGGRAMAEAAHAREIGLDLIVTDHHEPEGGALPGALAVVNPRRADCPYPFKQLAGVGVAFRLAQALLSSLPPDPTSSEREEFAGSLLDLVALGTIADVVPLLGENRGLVRDGLARINTHPRLGIAALMRAANVKAGSVNAMSVGFGLAPRLNAAGRLDTAMNAYDLLTATEQTWADELATALNERNTQRQAVTAEVAHAAEQAAFEGQAEIPALLFAASEEYNPGVIGLAAARLVERHYRPSVVVAIQNGEARGSCRSTEGFHITSALDECRSLLSKHGGHAAAAGFSTRADLLDDLRRQLLAIAQREQPPDGWTRAVRADAEVRLEKLTFQTYDQLRQLEPHGMGNPKPVFVTRGAGVQSARRVGRADAGQQPAHLQLRLRDGRGATWDAIGWRMGEREAEAPTGATIDVAFQLDVNEWNGERRLQLVVQDFR